MRYLLEQVVALHWVLEGKFWAVQPFTHLRWYLTWTFFAYF